MTLSGVTGRYMRYRAIVLAGSELTRVCITFDGDNASTEWLYDYDSAGNVVGVTTPDVTETRTYNDLQQLTDNVIDSVHWVYEHNDDGTLKRKKNHPSSPTETWDYTWDAAGLQQLESVSLNSVVQVAYSYDSQGRMLSRTPYTAGVADDPTYFHWDGWDCVREVTPAGIYRYYIPEGELLTFDYTPTGEATQSYAVLSDALGSVRAILDSNGDQVAHFETDPWGELLPTSDFGTLTDWPYGFVGAYGCRTDSITGLIYMRHRWYNPGIQTFLSREPRNSAPNLYAYCHNSPCLYFDDDGLDPKTAPRTNRVPGFSPPKKPGNATVDVFERTIDKTGGGKRFGGVSPALAVFGIWVAMSQGVDLTPEEERILNELSLARRLAAERQGNRGWGGGRGSRRGPNDESDCERQLENDYRRCNQLQDPLAWPLERINRLPRIEDSVSDEEGSDCYKRDRIKGLCDESAIKRYAECLVGPVTTALFPFTWY